MFTCHRLGEPAICNTQAVVNPNTGWYYPPIHPQGMIPSTLFPTTVLWFFCTMSYADDTSVTYGFMNCFHRSCFKHAKNIIDRFSQG